MMTTVSELKVGNLYFVNGNVEGVELPKGLPSEAHVLLIMHREGWCLVRTWRGKIYSVPEECLSLD